MGYDITCIMMHPCGDETRLLYLIKYTDNDTHTDIRVQHINIQISNFMLFLWNKLIIWILSIMQHNSFAFD